MRKEKNVVRIPLMLPITLIILVVLIMTTLLGGYAVRTAARYTTSNALTTEDGKFGYEELEDGTIKITSYLGKGTNVSIPEKINGTVVTQISLWGDYEFSNLGKITIPKTVTHIEGSWNIQSLQEINVSSSNEFYSSEDGVLFNKEKTELIRYPSGKKAIRYTIPEGVTDIEYFAFENCTNLKQILIAKTVRHISGFRSCTNLTEITISKEVTYISYDAFVGCTSLRNIHVSENNEYYSSEEGVLFDKEKTEILRYPSAKTFKEYSIPDTVTIIGEDAFENCKSLEKMVIPQNVQEIASYAFNNCTSLKEIEIPQNVQLIGYNAFSNCTSLEEIILPEGLYSLDSAVFENCTNLKQINIPSNLGYPVIGDRLFAGCSSLKQITIPEGITDIGNGAFQNCSVLEKVEIPNTVTSIEDYAFNWCERLKEINIPLSLEYIGRDAFSYCEALKGLTIPANVTEIGHMAFYDTRILKPLENSGNQEIDLPEIIKRTKIEGDILYTEEEFTLNNCVLNSDGTKLIVDSNDVNTKQVSLKINGGLLDGLTLEIANVTDDWKYIYTVLEDGTIEIKEYLGVDSEVFIPQKIEEKNVTNISKNAFEFSTILKKVTIPSGVQKIEDFTFSGCENLQEVLIPEGVTEIGMCAFDWCINLEKIMLPNGMTTIEDHAFAYCTKLTEISIPKSVTRIYNFVFSQCTNLKEINVAEDNEYYCSENGILFTKDKTGIICYPAGKLDAKYEIPEGVKTTSSFVFDGCKNLEEIVIPETLNNIAEGEFIFDECTNLKQISVSEDNEYFSSKNGVLFNKDKTKLIYYPIGKEETQYSIPEGVNTIGEYAFCGCKNIKEVNFPEGIISIEDNVFDECASLKKIEIPDNVTEIGHCAFANCYSLEEVIIPETTTEIDYYILSLSQITKVIGVGNDVTQEIELPEIIKRATQEDDILYSEEFELRNCKFNEDKTKLIVNTESVKEEDASLYIKSGVLADLSLEIRPSGTITYNEEGITRNSVTTTLQLAEGERVTNNNGKNTYTFTENGEFTFEYIDINGNTKTATAKVENIITDSLEIEGIEVTKQPKKTQYNSHEDFDPTGMVITLKYYDGREEQITNYTVVNGQDLTCLVDEIEIKYNKDTSITTKVPINVSHDIQEATCTEKAICKTEGCTYTENELGHSFTNYVSDNNATCTAEGTKTAKCNRCDNTDTITEPGSKKQHSYENGECTVCGQKEPTIKITSEKHNIDDLYISDIQVNTTIKDLKADLQTNATEINIYNKNGELQEETKVLATGMKIELKLNDETITLTLIVRGDANGDGKIKLSDMSLINRHRLGKTTLTGEYLLASDVTGDGKADFKDIVKINRFRLNKTTEL